MSNKSKSQHQQSESQQHMNKQSSVPLPLPQYQPPPQPTIGILKHSVGVAAATAAVSSDTSLNHPHFHTQNHQTQSQFQSTQSQSQPAAPQQPSMRATNTKDVGQDKFSSKLDHLVTQPMILGQSSKNTPQFYYPTKISQTQYLPPNSQYPISSNQINLKQRITDEEFLRLGPVEMLKFVRKTENDIARLVAEQNRQIQSLLNELRALKETNQRLSDDNQELRDLCCFLDDDRQKGRKLAREWQRFGRYTASVMRQEVSAYQNKLRQLDNKQQELIKDNLELKELCLYLDEERGGVQRDDGDGSSSSTNAEETGPNPTRARHAPTLNDQTIQYVRSLELRIKQLEEDKCMLQARAQTWEATSDPQMWDNPVSINNDLHHIGGRPEAVVQALQVLEVREQLERETGRDGEKALVREMCNVVWRKLEEGPQIKR
ncbi:hypothetical protein PV327_008043 [Microctonus hyperodae]|uniref:Coiled-coil domain-containing protein 85C n=1 Tax=Microctonus hyperodae TaxID=165561 RepID=A0AA39G0H0_MICHY|nr:hypothetical protein PV327_008043 [Microctonus hyperodae]